MLQLQCKVGSEFTVLKPSLRKNLTPAFVTPTLEQIRERLSRHRPGHVINQATRCAAVAAVLREAEDGPEILFIKRADKQGDPWSGHMAFPGGHVEDDDQSDRHAAERETLEEIGLDLSQHGQFLGTLDATRPYTSGRGLCVTPCVYELVTEPPQFELNHEVAEVHWANVGQMLRRETLCSYKWNLGDKARPMPGFEVGGRIVWGMTFGMVSRLFRVIDPDAPAFDGLA